MQVWIETFNTSSHRPLKHTIHVQQHLFENHSI
jgi:hypothetical protein